MSYEKNESSLPKSDKDLDDLLDSALDDFGKTPAATATNTNVIKTQNDDPLAGARPARDEQWNEEFLNQAKFFEEQMAALFGGTAPGVGTGGAGAAIDSEQISEGFARISEAAQRAFSNEGAVVSDADPTYIDHITQALKGLKDGSESISESNPIDNMGDLLAGLNLNDLGNEDSNPFMPFVQGMMHSLLSAEVLLPSLRELLEKYPKWLSENEQKIDAADKERYQKQQDLFKVICADLEQERADDSEDVKSERFKKVLANMQKLHEYGQPPAELVGGDDMMNGMPGMGGLPGIPGLGSQAMGDASQQCTLM